VAKKTFVISAYGDEISSDLQEQLKVIKELNINYLDIRGAWDKNVLEFDNNDVAKVKQGCKEYGIKVGWIGSPVGKSPIIIPMEEELAKLNRIFEIAESVGTNRIRMFSFFPPDTSNNMHYDLYLKEATDRIGQMVKLAEQKGFFLSLENEKGVVGDIPERCHFILHDINSQHLKFTWDPANFVQCGVSRVVERAWDRLGKYITCVHVKDALLTNGKVKPSGEGDGQVKDLLSNLRDTNYKGFLSLEHHLGKSVSNTHIAINALRKFITELGCTEAAEFKGF
jgi:sugar phosphate isomerase/epimerase